MSRRQPDTQIISAFFLLCAAATAATAAAAAATTKLYIDKYQPITTKDHSLSFQKNQSN